MFFFHSSGAHRALHSFPTRRSSDLDAVACLIAADHARDAAVLTAALKRWRVAIGEASRAVGYSLPVCVAVRSEEHTSELQSRENLVCRLLLEKKKLNKPSIGELRCR